MCVYIYIYIYIYIYMIMIHSRKWQPPEPDAPEFEDWSGRVDQLVFYIILCYAMSYTCQ